MFRSTAWLREIAALALIIAGHSGHQASAQGNAQVCVEDQYGRIVCGRPVDPNRVDLNRGAPRYQDPPAQRYYGPPAREIGPPPAERDYGPPPTRESAAPPARDYPPPPPGRQYRPSPERSDGPPPGREYAPPSPFERDQGRDPRSVDPRNPDSRNLDPRSLDPRNPDPRNADPRNADPRNLGRPYQSGEQRYQPPVPGPNGQMICPRDFFIQDGLCTPYIRR
jgi:hypothetical protein